MRLPGPQLLYARFLISLFFDKPTGGSGTLLALPQCPLALQALAFQEEAYNLRALHELNRPCHGDLTDYEVPVVL